MDLGASIGYLLTRNREGAGAFDVRFLMRLSIPSLKDCYIAGLSWGLVSRQRCAVNAVDRDVRLLVSKGDIGRFRRDEQAHAALFRGFQQSIQALLERGDEVRLVGTIRGFPVAGAAEILNRQG